MPTSRRKFIRTVGLGGTIALAGCTGGNGDGGNTGSPGNDPINLTHHSILPDNTVYTDAIKFFEEKVNEYADREINFEYHFQGELGGAGQATQLLKDGVADTAVVPPAYDSSRYPLSSVAQLPGLYSDATVAAPAFQQLIDNELGEHELNDVGIEVFSVGVNPPYNLAASDTRISQKGDVEGLVFRSISAVNNKTIDALGGSAEQVPYNEVVQALNRGTIDGATWQPNQYNNQPGAADPLNYHVTNISVTGSTTYYATAKDTWSNFPADVKDAFEKASSELNQFWPSGLVESDKKGKEEFGDQVDFYDISEDARESFESTFETVRDGWSDDQQSTSEAESILNAFFDYLEEAES